MTVSWKAAHLTLQKLWFGTSSSLGLTGVESNLCMVREPSVSLLYPVHLTKPIGSTWSQGNQRPNHEQVWQLDNTSHCFSVKVILSNSVVLKRFLVLLSWRTPFSSINTFPYIWPSILHIVAAKRLVVDFHLMFLQGVSVPWNQHHVANIFASITFPPKHLILWQEWGRERCKKWEEFKWKIL